jgi:hypothetical protein
MPKITPYDNQNMDGLTRATISHGIEKAFTNEDKLAVKMRCTKKTVQNKRRRPEILTLKDIRVLVKELKFSEREVIELLGFEWKGGTS